MKTLIIYSEDNNIGLMPFSDLKIEIDSCLYGGEEMEIYSVYVYFDDKMIFTANNKKEILHQGDKLFIYNF